MFGIRESLYQLRSKYMDNFFFIHINKTGGSSVERALSLTLEHKTALEKIEEVGLNEWEKRFTFTVVRNPWDKVVSHYHYRVATNQTCLKENTIPFTKWVELTLKDRNPEYYDNPKMFMPQVNWISDEENNIIVNKVCLLENIDADFESVCHAIGKKVQLPHLKSSKHQHYSGYYNDETQEIVRQWFEQDIRTFGYSFVSR